MLAATKLTVVRGDTATFEFAARRGDYPIDLTEVQSILFTIRASTSSGKLIQKRLHAGVYVMDEALGLFSVTLFPPDTTSFASYRRLVYDVEVTDVEGTVTTIQAGYLMVIEDVSR